MTVSLQKGVGNASAFILRHLSSKEFRILPPFARKNKTPFVRMIMASVPFFLVDAFTQVPFRGNPAAVVILDQERETTWLQLVAMEMNQAETAFLTPHTEGFGLRWFTPTVEVDLCGHATLASAHVLWKTHQLPLEAPARFQTRSGWLGCRRQGDVIAMDFPAQQVTPKKPPTGLLEALGVREADVLGNDMDYFVVLQQAQVLRELRPQFAALQEVSCRGVIVTAPSDLPGFDFLSRFFAPQSGIPEDPVTGSAHCALGPYWGQKLGKTTLQAFQASPRGGCVTVINRGHRVELQGQAVTVVRGELTV
jgi:PhzF family phenazine biosynthesis protein